MLLFICFSMEALTSVWNYILQLIITSHTIYVNAPRLVNTGGKKGHISVVVLAK